MAALEAVAKAGHQILTLPRLAHGKTLLDGHRKEEATSVGGIAFSLMWGGDTQTLGCCHNFTSTLGIWGHVMMIGLTMHGFARTTFEGWRVVRRLRGGKRRLMGTRVAHKKFWWGWGGGGGGGLAVCHSVTVGE